jgi:hypothetical protein
MILDAKSMQEKREQIGHYVAELDSFAELSHAKALSLVHDFVIEQEIKRLFETATEETSWGKIQYIRGMLAMQIDKVLSKVEDILQKEKKDANRR